jgi:single-strand DNA-binding protein
MTETVLHMLGHVGTDVDHRKVGEGIDLSTFRLASTPRRWDKGQRGYVDGATNWITVQCWRSLAAHVRDSVRRGDPVIVVGRLKTEEWTKDEVRNTRFVLEATAVGHDLTRGTSSFVKAVRQAGPVTDESADALAAVQEIERDQESVTGPSEPEPADLDLDEVSDQSTVGTTTDSSASDAAAHGDGGQSGRAGWPRAS